MKRSLAALALVLVTGCMGTTAHTRGQQTTYARPEPDPACHGILAQCLADTGLERVVVKVGVSEQGKPALLDVLTPDLTDAVVVEIRRALEGSGCVWKPAVGPDGTRVAGTLTLAIQR